MKKQLMMAVAGLAIVVSSGAALAGSCPKLINEIQAAIDSRAGTPEARASAKMALTEGQRLHDAGEHDKSMATLASAKKELGLE